jgi:hypothetical protein
VLPRHLGDGDLLAQHHAVERGVDVVERPLQGAARGLSVGGERRQGEGGALVQVLVVALDDQQRESVTQTVDQGAQLVTLVLQAARPGQVQLDLG